MGEVNQSSRDNMKLCVALVALLSVGLVHGEQGSFLYKFSSTEIQNKIDVARFTPGVTKTTMDFLEAWKAVVFDHEEFVKSGGGCGLQPCVDEFDCGDFSGTDGCWCDVPICTGIPPQ